MKVLFITLFSEISGSSRIIAYQFLPFLEKAGIKYRAESIYPDKFFKTQMGLEKVGKIKKQLNFVFYLFLGILKQVYFSIESRNYDVIFIQRTPFPKSIYRLLLYMNPNVIYEFEDTFYEINPFLKRGFLRRLLLNYQRGLYKNMVEKAARIIAVNEYVAEEAKTVNKNITIICEPINTDICLPAGRHGRPAGFRRNDGKITIGWIGSPSTTPFLKDISDVFPEIAKRYPQARLKTVGAASDFNVPGASLIKKEWSLKDELNDLQSFDIGIMPLDSDPFYRGHLGHKMIQYMCVGIPVIASNAGLNYVAVKNGINGFLVSSRDEWVDKLSLLIENEDFRRQMGQNGRKMAEELFSLEKLSAILIDVIRKPK